MSLDKAEDVPEIVFSEVVTHLHGAKTSCPDGRKSLNTGESCDGNEENCEHRTTSCWDCQARNSRTMVLAAILDVTWTRYFEMRRYKEWLHMDFRKEIWYENLQESVCPSQQKNPRRNHQWDSLENSVRNNPLLVTQSNLCDRSTVFSSIPHDYSVCLKAFVNAYNQIEH